VVGLGRRDDPERPPEPANAVAGLAPEHGLVSEVDRGIGIEIELEELGVLDCRR
jgi:hypothetical protein